MIFCDDKTLKRIFFTELGSIANRGIEKNKIGLFCPKMASSARPSNTRDRMFLNCSLIQILLISLFFLETFITSTGFQSEKRVYFYSYLAYMDLISTSGWKAVSFDTQLLRLLVSNILHSRIEFHAECYF